MFLQMSSLVMIGEVHTSILCMGYGQIHLLGGCTVCKPFCMLTDGSKHFILHLHSHWLISQITALISCMLRRIVSLSHLIHNKCRIVIAVHVDTILHILDLISSRKEICLRCDHCSAWEHDGSASSGSPLIMSRTSGYKILNSDIFLSVIYL